MRGIPHFRSRAGRGGGQEAKAALALTAILNQKVPAPILASRRHTRRYRYVLDTRRRNSSNTHSTSSARSMVRSSHAILLLGAAASALVVGTAVAETNHEHAAAGERAKSRRRLGATTSTGDTPLEVCAVIGSYYVVFGAFYLLCGGIYWKSLICLIACCFLSTLFLLLLKACPRCQ